MSEIEFLATLLLNKALDEESKVQIINRIVLLSKEKTYTPFVQAISPWTPIGTPADLCQHEYPNPWGATTPPFCKKCGKQATHSLVVSGTSGVVTLC